MFLLIRLFGDKSKTISYQLQNMKIMLQLTYSKLTPQQPESLHNCSKRSFLQNGTKQSFAIQIIQ